MNLGPGALPDPNIYYRTFIQERKPCLLLTIIPQPTTPLASAVKRHFRFAPCPERGGGAA
ncbi:MAG: hypothetical protein LUC47_01780, partial [Clostridiales bacterium]|nr:hypothetical protein [Clostridiales bacterium]